MRNPIAGLKVGPWARLRRLATRTGTAGHPILLLSTFAAVTMLALAASTALVLLLSASVGPFAATAVVTLLFAIVLVAAGFAAPAIVGRIAALNERARKSDFAALAESMPGAVIHYRSDGTPLSISRSTSVLLDCRLFELDGMGLFERVHVMDRPIYRKAISDAANGAGPTTIELRLRRDTSEPGAATRYLWVELSLSPLSNGSDASCEVLGVLRDISARKGAEREVEVAWRRAEEASEAKSRFLATIGHELRTPLNAIVGFSDMMVEGIGGELSPTHAEYASHINTSGQHLLQVVNMLLDMSKIEAGKFEVHTELFAPQGLVEPCLQMVEKLARDRSIALETNIPERLPQIIGDERACRQILINLLTNAIKFSHDNGRINLALKRQGRMLAISVSDSGIGMRPETIQRIGEPFLQAQDGLSRHYEGTGLGLSIVKGLVALHEGRLDVVSEPGLGTTVTVLLPIDGPANASRTASIEHLHVNRRDSDEDKWLEEERRSAAQ